MGAFRHDPAGRVGLLGEDEAADFGAAVRAFGREALPASGPG